MNKDLTPPSQALLHECGKYEQGNVGSENALWDGDRVILTDFGMAARVQDHGEMKHDFFSFMDMVMGTDATKQGQVGTYGALEGI